MTIATRPWRLSGFGDEIDDDPVAQAGVLDDLGLSFIEVRSAWGINIIDLDRSQLDVLAGRLRAHGLGVSAIASPVGKAPSDVDIDLEVDRLLRAITAAEVLESGFIRVFSFYVPESGAASARDGVLWRLAALERLARRAGVVLLHENEKRIYGDTPERVNDLIESLGSEYLRVAWDPANFVEVGVAPFTDGYDLLRPHLAYLQIKDAVRSTGRIVPAGEGDGQLPETVAALVADGFEGFVSMEPHLSVAGDSRGFSGPNEFARAVAAFRGVASDAGAVLV